MKRKTLTTALLAGLAGSAGIANIADAVNWNPHNLGQVLIYPYYTTRGGTQGVNNYDTLISIVNTTDQVKAVKMRFREALTSREVLDFNLYLSAYDVWVAAVFDGDCNPAFNGGDPDCGDGLADGAVIVTNDHSCTVPSIEDFGPVDFRTTLFEGPPLPTGRDRTREGYLTAIEMGVVTGAAATAATHSIDTDGDGWADTPTNCDMLAARWTPPPLGGVGSCGGPLTFAGNIACWFDVDPDFEMTPPTGGLFGHGQLVNVPDGTDYGYNAVAIGDFSDPIIHFSPGNQNPTLGLGNPTSWVADYEFSGTTNPVVHNNAWITNTHRAVSAVLMVDTVMNEYAVEENLDGGTDWVVGFPTKWAHIAAFPGIGFPPFTDANPRPPLGTGTDDYCEEFSFFWWNREEQFVRPDVGGPPFSPPPFDPEEELPKFCAEINVVSFDSTNVLYATPKTSSGASDGTRIDFLVSSVIPATDAFETGWARIDFNANFQPIPGFIPPPVPLHRMVSDPVQGFDRSGFEGLPTVGFSVQRTVNGQLNIGGVNLLSNYGALFEHATVQDISFVNFD